MNSRVKQRNVRSTRIVNRKEPLSLGYLLLTIACATLMAAGFFFVAVQHFVSMEIGFKNSTMRKQITELEAEKRRLLLAKEVVLSPVEITRTATKLGFRETETIMVAATANTTPKPADAVLKQDKQQIAADRNTPAVAAIVSSKPVQSSSRPAKTETATKREPENLSAGIESRPRRVATEREPASRLVTTVARLR